MMLPEFQTRCEPAARDVEDRLCRYVSSWREWDLAWPTLFPLVLLRLKCLIAAAPEKPR